MSGPVNRTDGFGFGAYPVTLCKAEVIFLLVIPAFSAALAIIFPAPPKASVAASPMAPKPGPIFVKIVLPVNPKGSRLTISPIPSILSSLYLPEVLSDNSLGSGRNMVCPFSIFHEPGAKGRVLS